MRSLHLSTVRAKEANVVALLQHLKGDPARSASSSRGNAPAVDVFLQVHDSLRATFLDHAQSLYAAVIQSAHCTNVSVIPVTQFIGGGGDGAVAADHALPLQLPLYLDKAFIAASPGFQPSFRYVAVGGTFDHLHEGHKLLLTTALLHTTDRLRVGVTGEALLVNKKFASALQPIEERKAAAVAFMRKIRQDVELEVDVIVDMCGGTDTIAGIEALVVSPETEKSLPHINELRWSKGQLPPLAPIHVPHVRATDGTVLSSTQLRQHLQQQGESPAT